MIRHRCAVIGALVLVLPVVANDTLVTLGAGGLIPLTTPAIAMESEELEISVHRISVKYVFRNTTDRDEDVLVAFPLPPMNGGEVANIPIDIPSHDPLNFVDFHVFVNGQPVAPAAEVRAFFEDSEITARLRELRLPLSVLDTGVTAAVKKLSEVDRSRIVKDHWVDCSLTRDGKCWPYWLSRTQYYWKQRFAAGAAVEIRHTYRPVVGGSRIYPSDDGKASVAEYCGGEDAVARIRHQKEVRHAHDGDDTVLFAERRIEYILTTGANWKGPIRNFHLSILSDAPDDIVLTCVPGLKRVAPNRYELTKRDFRPAQELEVLILQAGK